MRYKAENEPTTNNHGQASFCFHGLPLDDYGRLHDFEIRAGMQGDDPVYDSDINHLCYQQSAVVASAATVQCPCETPILARYVSIQINNPAADHAMIICEMRIFGAEGMVIIRMLHVIILFKKWTHVYLLEILVMVYR